MDILTHTITGFAVGTVLAGFSGKKNNANIILLSGLGGAFPDIDAISMWSRFDGTFGSLFGLGHTGKEIYVSKFWYSHHAFFHSLLSAFLLAIIIGIICWISQIKRNPSILKYFEANKLMLLSFISGYSFHLLEDMPTPIGAWKGVAFLWPYSGYIGGTGQIWWWNNYDIFLIVLIILSLNLIILCLKGRFLKLSKYLPLSLFVFGFGLSVHQINKRPFNFNYIGHGNKYEYLELKSKQVQKEILGIRVYSIMESFDNKIRLNF